MYDGPVLDNHLHLDPVNGRGAEAAAEFADAGGTHLNVLNKPSWNLVGEVDGADGFREGLFSTFRWVPPASANSAAASAPRPLTGSR